MVPDAAAGAGRPLVLQCEDLEPQAERWLADRVRLVRCGRDDPRFAGLLADARGLVVRTYTRVDAALLEGAPKLRVVGRGGVALENIDLSACAARGVRVVHTPEANTQAVVEFVLALLLDGLRPRVVLDGPLTGEAWHAARRELQADRQLADMTVGVLGFGRIGSRVGRALRALGCPVLCHDLRALPEAERHGCEPVADVRELFSRCDAVTLHVDWRRENHHLVGAELLELLGGGGVLVNTSRGLVVDPAAVAGWLGRNPGAMALLDVHDPYEPMDAGYPLLGVENAFLTPHIAAATAAARLGMSWVVRDVVAVLEGAEPRWPASMPAAVSAPPAVG